MEKRFLPVTKQEMIERGWDQVDFVYVSGDAYVDHPSFGPAIITRVLEAHGYKIGIIAQPDYRDPESINVFGEPRLGFFVSAGNMDSMVNHYTVSKKRRHQDAYTPGGVAGKRPDRAVIVYSNLIRQTYKNTPIIIGGIEASLRRLGHYDYWSNKVRRSILLESGADIISYGMGEHSVVEIADALNSGLEVQYVTFIDGTVYKTRDEESIYDAIRLPDFEEIERDKTAYAKSFAIQYRNTDPFVAKRIYECYGGHTFVVQNPPAKPLSEMEMDDTYALPYTREYHPMYEEAGGIPALGEIKFSLTSNRGCFGECNFCALTMHQGRIVQARSHESILDEAKVMTEDKDFKGYIHDVGGPTAEFRRPACNKQMTKGACVDKKCLWPKPCPAMVVDHSDYIKLLKEVRALPGVKKVFVRSGVRFDYLMADPDKTFLKELCEHHVSGQLRVAPEHISDNVLSKMGKPSVNVYNSFIKEFKKINEKLGLNQYVVPYLMSSHPGSTLEDAIALAEYIRDMGYIPEQVQDFYPTPATVSTTMYYTGMDPFTLQPVYVAKDPHEKAMQRALIQYRNPENYELVKEALLKCHREDLIGFRPEFLIPPHKMKGKYNPKKAGNATAKDKQDGGESRDDKARKPRSKSNHKEYEKNKKPNKYKYSAWKSGSAKSRSKKSGRKKK
ncbi:MAG: YgiQ family radical SAM protein [Lachnospiraceae bacterium]|nr:YgiQ family radical SAM protein [Lachnospiraceae bacterium]